MGSAVYAMINVETLIALVWAYRYVAMYGILVVSAMGVPVPEEPILLASGLAVGWHQADYWLATVVCVLGIVSGDLYIYTLGYFYGERFLQTRLGGWVFNPKRQARIESLYARHGCKTVFFGRLLPAIRFGVFFFAGQHRMNLVKFFSLNLLGASLNGPITIFIGAYAARKIADSEKAIALAKSILHEGQAWLFGILALIACVCFVRWLKSRWGRSPTVVASPKPAAPAGDGQSCSP